MNRKNSFLTKNLDLVKENDIYLERRELNRLLDQALESPLVTVVAGEGYGKTHSVHSFLQSSGVVTIWVQLSKRDNLGWRFWENYTGAISLNNPEAGVFLANLGFPETTRQFDRYITLFQNTFIAQMRYVVVLDDFHLIHEPPVLRFLERSMVIPLVNTTIILIARKEPGINTVSLLSKGRLSQITVNDLRFRKQEISEYFTLQSIELSPEELERIYNDTEGWALLINLIAREMQDGKTKQQNYSFRSLEDKVFGTISGGLRKLLIKLSLIEHWPPELLERLALGPGVIAEMETFSSFIRYDAYLHSYRIHHLFLDFLKEKQGELSSGEIRDVYIKAAQWCLENNLRTDAALDYERARDYWGLVRVINLFPRVLPNAVAVFFLGIIDRILALESTEFPVEGDAGYEDFVLLCDAIRPRLLMSQGRLEEAVAENRASIAKFEALPPSPLGSRILAACYNCLGTLAILAARPTRNYNVAPFFEEANRYYMRYPRNIRGPITQACIGTYCNQVGYPAKAGELENSIREFSPAVAPASNSFNGYLYGVDTLAWAELALYTGDLLNAEKLARQAVFKGRKRNQVEVENRALFFLLRINLNTGNFSEIREVLRQLEVQLENPEFFNRYILYDIVTGWFYAQIGQTGKIASWLKNDFEESELNTMFHGFETLVKAKCSFAEKRYDAVLTTLSRPGGKFGMGEYTLGFLEMTVLQAVSLFNMGEKEQAFMALEDAWKTAVLNALDMPFIELGEDMYALTGAWINEKTGPIARPWLETIRSKASIYAKKLSVVVGQYESQAQSRTAPVITLSPREKEVLAGLSQGLTREEIAGETALSLNVVKNTISSVYTKLGALNRADAIRIATASGLLKNADQSIKIE
jgi:LuxR family maltose regulon positive regulatory protein